MQEALLKPEEAAERLNLSPATLAKKRWAGGKDAIPFVKMGRSVRYRPSDIEAYAAGRIRRSTFDAGEAANAQAS